MKRRYESLAIALIIVLALIVVGVASYDLLSPRTTHAQQSTTYSFVQQPVVDLIIPTLFRQQGSDSGNLPLNVTRGENVPLSIDIYTTVTITFSMKCEIYLLSVRSGTSTASTTNSTTILASFNPQSLIVNASAKGVSTMHLSVLSQTLVGEYTAVVTAVNVYNSTQSWGDIFQINVSG